MLHFLFLALRSSHSVFLPCYLSCICSTSTSWGLWLPSHTLYSADTANGTSGHSCEEKRILLGNTAWHLHALEGKSLVNGKQGCLSANTDQQCIHSLCTSTPSSSISRLAKITLVPICQYSYGSYYYGNNDLVLFYSHLDTDRKNGDANRVRSQGCNRSEMYKYRQKNPWVLQLHKLHCQERWQMKWQLTERLSRNCKAVRSSWDQAGCMQRRLALMGLISQPTYSTREQEYMLTGIHMITCVSQSSFLFFLFF